MTLIRLALDTEEDVFVDMARACVAESYPDQAFSEARAREEFRSYLETAHPTLFFAVHGDEVVGALKAGISAVSCVDAIATTLYSVFIRPDKRGTRAAAMLIAEFCRWSDALGAIESTGGNDNNLTTERTTRLLGHFGFAPVGTFVRRKFGAGHGKKGR